MISDKDIRADERQDGWNLSKVQMEGRGVHYVRRRHTEKKRNHGFTAITL
jgi:hypothetical protein